jgi:mono/diheme cytochrome c family protein
MNNRSSMFSLLVVTAGLLSASVAHALPWDVDMADSQAVKAYEQIMQPLPEGTVSQANVLTPRSFSPNYERTSPEGMALTNPLQSSESVLSTGETMYKTYCMPCHGMGAKLGPVAQPGRFPGVIPISGSAKSVLSMRTDGYVYLTIRNGGPIMPYYGWAMTDDEMWSVVHYVRTLDGGAYAPATPPPTETEAVQ